MFWGMLCVASMAWYLQLPLVISYVTALHVRSVVKVFLALNLWFVAFQISLHALNSSVQMPMWSDLHGKLKCKSWYHLSPGHDCGCFLVLCHWFLLKEGIYTHWGIIFSLLDVVLVIFNTKMSTNRPIFKEKNMPEKLFFFLVWFKTSVIYWFLTRSCHLKQCFVHTTLASLCVSTEVFSDILWWTSTCRTKEPCSTLTCAKSLCYLQYEKANAEITLHVFLSWTGARGPTV